MSTVKPYYIIFGIFLQILIDNANGKPVCPGEYDSGYGTRHYKWAPSPAIIPCPRPVPVPEPRRENYQSVTIPNIIMALLPPTNKHVPAVQPKPVIRPAPVVLPSPSSHAFSTYLRFSGFGGGSIFGGCGCA